MSARACGAGPARQADRTQPTPIRYHLTLVRDIRAHVQSPASSWEMAPAGLYGFRISVDVVRGPALPPLRAVRVACPDICGLLHLSAEVVRRAGSEVCWNLRTAAARGWRASLGCPVERRRIQGQTQQGVHRHG